MSNVGRELAAAFNLDVPAPLSLPPADADDVDLLYLSGQERLDLSDADVAGTARLLSRGGCCSPRGARPDRMATVARGSSRSRSSTSRIASDGSSATCNAGTGSCARATCSRSFPPGARERARVLEANGVIYSDADYGCAWQGGPADRPLVRGAIRDALEFGVNIATFRRS